MTDSNKYKSIAVRIKSYNKVKLLTNRSYMSISSFISYLVDKEFEQQMYRQGWVKNKNNSL